MSSVVEGCTTTSTFTEVSEMKYKDLIVCILARENVSRIGIAGSMARWCVLLCVFSIT